MEKSVFENFAVERGWVLVGEGYDNAVYSDAAREKIFRVPKKTDGRSVVELEAVVLPQLAAQNLGAFIPVPTLNEGDSVFFAEYPFVRGALYDELSTKEQEELLVKLTGFLSNLHKVETAPFNMLPQINWYEKCATLYQEVIEHKDLFTAAQLKYAKNLFDSYLNHPEYRTIAPALVHADISLDHVYYDAGKISVIDWSDFCITDPAYEFHHLFEEVDLKKQHLLQYYYIEADPTFWKRAAAYRFLTNFDALFDFIKSGNQTAVEDCLGHISGDMLGCDDNVLRL